MKARAANLNAALWTFYTFLAIVGAWVIGSVIVTAIMIAKDPVLRNMFSTQPPDKDGILEYLKTQNMVIPQIFIMFCGVGGYLFIHYLLTRKARLSAPPDSSETN
jgi:hypothetical protein